MKPKPMTQAQEKARIKETHDRLMRERGVTVMRFADFHGKWRKTAMKGALK